MLLVFATKFYTCFFMIPFKRMLLLTCFNYEAFNDVWYVGCHRYEITLHCMMSR